MLYLGVCVNDVIGKPIIGPKYSHQALLFIIFISEINPTPTTPVFIHTGETISLDCTLSIIAESAGTSEIKWYKGGEEVVQKVGVVDVLNGVYDGTNELQKSTYTDMDVDKDDGGVYKCEFTFDFGEKISFETTVHVHRKYRIEVELSTVDVPY